MHGLARRERHAVDRNLDPALLRAECVLAEVEIDGDEALVDRVTRNGDGLTDRATAGGGVVELERQIGRTVDGGAFVGEAALVRKRRIHRKTRPSRRWPAATNSRVQEWKG